MNGESPSTGNPLRCVFCPASTGLSVAGGWTTRTLDAPVTFRSTLDGNTSSTAAGTYHLCPVCSEWLTDHRDRLLPPAVVDSIDALLAAAGCHPTTARHARAEMVGAVRAVAEALTGPPES